MNLPPLELLGVSPNAGEREIKQAYARLLKRFRPDEDPDGFQRLNEAYQAALIITQRAAGDGTRARIQPATSDPGMRLADAVGQPEDASDGLPTWRIAPDPHMPRIRISQMHCAVDSTPRPSMDDLRFDHLTFSHLLIARALTATPQDVRSWLAAQPDLVSLVTKDATIPFLLDRLECERPLGTPQLEVILAFFGLHEINRHSGLQRRISALRQRSRTAHPTWADLQFRESPSRRRSTHLGDFNALFIMCFAGLIGMLRMCQGAG